jgi:hypothetical protein
MSAPAKAQDGVRMTASPAATAEHPVAFVLMTGAHTHAGTHLLLRPSLHSLRCCVLRCGHCCKCRSPKLSRLVRTQLLFCFCSVLTQVLSAAPPKQQAFTGNVCALCWRLVPHISNRVSLCWANTWKLLCHRNWHWRRQSCNRLFGDRPMGSPQQHETERCSSHMTSTPTTSRHLSAHP